MNLNMLPWFGGIIGVGIILAFFLNIERQAAKVPSLQQQIKTFQAQSILQTAMIKKAEDLRSQQQKQAVLSVEQMSIACQARIDEAKRSADAIRNMTHAVVKLDKRNCAVRALLDPTKLRNAIGAP